MLRFALAVTAVFWAHTTAAQTAYANIGHANGVIVSDNNNLIPAAQIPLATVTEGASAAGTNQATATALTTTITTFTTVASGTGFVLQNLGVGSLQTVYNRGANPLLPYPYAGSTAQIDTAIANAASTVPVPVGGTAQFRQTTATLFRQTTTAD
jgi:hypothetical protein